MILGLRLDRRLIRQRNYRIGFSSPVRKHSQVLGVGLREWMGRRVDGEVIVRGDDFLSLFVAT